MKVLAATHQDWLLFDQDECWFSRFAQPTAHAWAAHRRPLRLVQRQAGRAEEQKALACFGAVRQGTDQVYLDFCQGQPNSEQAWAFVQRLRVDGIIICSTSVSQEHHRQFKKFGVPIVLVNNQATEENENSIYHDDQFGNRELTRHLIEIGHKRIGYLGNVLAGRTTQDRLDGFEEEMNAAGLSIPAEHIFQGPNGRPEGGFVGGEYFIQQSNRPTAIICFNDMMAIGVVKALKQSGLSVPADCSVVGFDNISISAYVNPSLTTFDQPKYHQGRKAAQMLLGILNPSPEEEVRQPDVVMTRGEILVRESTGPPTN